MIDFQERAESDIDVAADEIDRTLRTPGEVFLQRLQRTLELLESFPLLGAEHTPAAPEYPGLRVFQVGGWCYSVYYQPRDDGISVVRVLHASRNIAAMFNPDPDRPATPPGS